MIDAPLKIILRGALVLRPGGDPSVMKGADIYIRGQQLAAVGHVGQPFPTHEADEVIDLSDRLVMPGLVNAHTHTPMTFLRGVAQDVGLSDFFATIRPH